MPTPERKRTPSTMMNLLSTSLVFTITAAAVAQPAPHLIYPDDPPLPVGMTLEETLDAAASPPPPDFPDVVMDDKPYGFLLFDQLEWRVVDDGTDALGWDAFGWYGGDYDRLWIKSEGEVAFDGSDAGDGEHDLLYSRLVAPFWFVQGGVQYAQEWESADHSDRWSLAAAFVGLAPGQFEVDLSLYLSEDADVTGSFEAEYDLRVTQRLVLQPRIEIGFAAQDVSERLLGAGLTSVDFDLRLRYEITRKFAPYAGVRYGLLVGDTADLADTAGDATESWSYLFGVRLAF